MNPTLFETEKLMDLIDMNAPPVSGRVIWQAPFNNRTVENALKEKFPLHQFGQHELNMHFVYAYHSYCTRRLSLGRYIALLWEHNEKLINAFIPEPLTDQTPNEVSASQQCPDS